MPPGISYVGPYSPAAYQAAGQLANGGSGAPASPAVIQAGQAIDASQGGGGTGGTGGSATTGGDPSLLAALQARVGQINQMYQSLYGSMAGGQGAGTFGGGVQGAENILQAGYVPQYQQVGLQAGQDANQLANIMAARGLGSSSYAGTQEQNLGANAQNEDAGILANYQSNLANLEGTAEKQRKSDIAAQQAMNQNLQTLQTAAPNMDPSTAAYEISSSYGGLGNTIPQLAGEQSASQTPQQAFQQFQGIAPSQVFTPQQMQQTLSGIGQSSLPTYLQQQLGSGLINANSLTPGDANYWLQYLQNLTPSFS